MIRIMQVVATKRAEKCSYYLISSLLNNYFEAADEVESEVPDGDATVVTVDDDGLMTTGQDRESSKECKPDNGKITENNKLLIAQNSLSSNTSVEIYR